MKMLVHINCVIDNIYFFDVYAVLLKCSFLYIYQLSNDIMVTLPTLTHTPTLLLTARCRLDKTTPLEFMKHFAFTPSGIFCFP